jgi:hypothetical protein
MGEEVNLEKIHLLELEIFISEKENYGANNDL